jgi:DNA (cytosine-5)-methyltransferase 1
MAPQHLARVRAAEASGQPQVGTVYKRIRVENGRKVQRAEVRFDGVSGCLRTPAGGSSRQILILVEPGRVRTRLLTPREAARLMGVPDSYPLPARYNEAYHLMGDGVVVPAVAWLERSLLRPLVRESGCRNRGIVAI